MTRAGRGEEFVEVAVIWREGNEHVAVYCHGCGHAWWNDAECACTCQPGDPNYEKWAAPSAVGFEILNG